MLFLFFLIVRFLTRPLVGRRDASLGVPVKLVGTGEGVGDLVPFDPDAFARRLVA